MLELLAMRTAYSEELRLANDIETAMIDPMAQAHSVDTRWMNTLDIVFLRRTVHGKWIFNDGNDKTGRLWDVRSGKEVRRWGKVTLGKGNKRGSD